MSEEKINESKATEESGVSLKLILYVLWSRKFLILFITLLFAVGGYAYSRLRVPEYTASVPLTFKTTAEKLEEGSKVVSTDGVSSTNYLYAYFDTALEYTTSGSVMDRANVYYGMYKEAKKENSELTIDEFVGNLKTLYANKKAAAVKYTEVIDKYESLVEYYKEHSGSVVPQDIPVADADGTDYVGLVENYAYLLAEYDTIRDKYRVRNFSEFPEKPVAPEGSSEIVGYEVTEENMKLYRDRFVKRGRVGINSSASKSAEGNFSSVLFKIWVKAYDPVYASELARIYAFAADVAINIDLEFDSLGTAGFYEMINDSNGVAVVSDKGTKKTVVIAAVIGLAISLVIFYISYIADSTIKNKEMLEEITGSSVIAFIDDVTGGKK